MGIDAGFAIDYGTLMPCSLKTMCATRTFNFAVISLGELENLSRFQYKVTRSCRCRYASSRYSN